jgi:hypothetical protein
LKIEFLSQIWRLDMNFLSEYEIGSRLSENWHDNGLVIAEQNVKAFISSSTSHTFYFQCKKSQHFFPI